ncbi:hypothetical protein ET495_06735 [Xylanimonas allomyrinae]|uniref:Uncharacterized protein n=1 Tax=Xylanimonas allomyrinae TaxID=2509459 RepID=A0A4P6ENS1_9MICO|nr:hypothetical protein [Xylanimonas allomyrinae]QAY62989.1 hypothetical protein ET495_06735 [Xylanimonas allomyrinae]
MTGTLRSMWQVVPVWWLVVGVGLVVTGGVVARRVALRAREDLPGPAGGLTLAVGLSLAFWGLVAVVVGLVVVLR